VRPPILRAAFIVFTASFCTLVIELVAGRCSRARGRVAVHVDGIIGVVLAGISAGAYAGGWIADRRPAPSTLGWLLFAAGVTAIAIAPATSILAGDEGLLTSSASRGPSSHASSSSRSCCSSCRRFPRHDLAVAVKLAVRDLDTAGRTVGKIYAFSTLGSIAGTFVTGFWLVAEFGTRSTLIGTGVVLITAALLLGDLLGRRGRVYAVLVVIAGGVFAYSQQKPPLPPYHDPCCTRASARCTSRRASTTRSASSGPYARTTARRSTRCTSITSCTRTPIRKIRISRVRLPPRIQHGRERHRAARADFRLLFIGGGGYAAAAGGAQYPRARVDVAEIDPR
jgi:hypothetical protein